MDIRKPITFSEHVVTYADSRLIALDEIVAALRTEAWHPRGGGRFECRKSFPRAGWEDTKQVRVLFLDEPSRIVVVTAYAYLVRTRVAA